MEEGSPLRNGLSADLRPQSKRVRTPVVHIVIDCVWVSRQRRGCSFHDFIEADIIHVCSIYDRVLAWRIIFLDVTLLKSSSIRVITYFYYIYYFQFWKGMNPLTPSCGLNSITAILLQGWLWQWITHDGWYAIKENKTELNKWLRVSLCFKA